MPCFQLKNRGHDGGIICTDCKGESYELSNSLRDVGEFICSYKIVTIEVLEGRIMIVDKSFQFEHVTTIIGSVKCIGDMSYLFCDSKLDHPIDHWDMSEVTSTRCMFENSLLASPDMSLKRHI